MRTVFLASALILVCVAAAAPQARTAVASRRRASITATAKHGKTQLAVRTRSGKHYSLLVSRDSTVSASATPGKVKLVGEINQSTIIITDSYPSIPGAMSFCQAGEETFLRVISLAARTPKETFKLKLESCRDSLELESNGLEWLPQTATLRVHWLTGPGGNGTPEVREINLTREGTPR
jgi:hypothetical protein